MDDRRKTVAAVTLIVLFICFVILIGSILVLRKKPVVSPVPDEGAIKIIFVTLTPTPPPADGPTPTLKPKATATPKPTPKNTATPTPTKAASPSATPKP